MKETVTNIYCDILSAHNGQKVPGASTYKDVMVLMQGEDGEAPVLEKRTLDMCPSCYGRYHVNLFAVYDNRRRISYSFESTNTTTTTNS